MQGGLVSNGAINTKLPHPPQGRVAAIVMPVRASQVKVGGSKSRRRRPQSVPGEFVVDHRCIDCDACLWLALKTFTRVDEQSAVCNQPSSEEERLKALQALLSCPTASIHTEKTMPVVYQTFAFIRKLLDLEFERILPGHRRRIQFKDEEANNIVLEAFVARKEASLLQPV